MNDWIIPDWPAPASVRALSTTRSGGFSQGPWASLNLGTNSGDDPADVHRNREALNQVLPAEPRWLQQVHGTTVLRHDGGLGQSGNRSPDASAISTDNTSVVGGQGKAPGPQFGEAASLSKPPEADAQWSNTPGAVCVVLTADCLPVLFCDRAGTRVAAAHAGWRGLAAGVLENTVAALDVPPGELLAWLGPAIGPAVYQVGDEVRAAFRQQEAAGAQAFVEDGDRWLFNLYAMARFRLQQAGVSHISGGNYCTFSNPKRFFSYRRDQVTGRMATLVWLL